MMTKQWNSNSSYLNKTLASISKTMYEKDYFELKVKKLKQISNVLENRTKKR